MKEDKIVVYKKYASAVDANIEKGVLETNGVPCFLSNENIFGIDLYKAGIGEKIEEMFLEEIAGPGAVRTVLKKYMA